VLACWVPTVAYCMQTTAFIMRDSSSLHLGTIRGDRAA
jgi:hypothetical protein